MSRFRLTFHLALGLASLGMPAFAQVPAPPAAVRADPRGANLSAYVELLRSDVRAEKVAILTEMMEFTDEEDTVFWPIYREYDAELTKINDDRVALIGEYAAGYDEMTDAIADRLARAALDLEARRQALTRKYYERVASALSPKVATRFLQVEHQLLLIIDLQIAAALPVVK